MTRLPAAAALALLACGPGETTDESVPSDPTVTFDIPPPDVDTDFPTDGETDTDTDTAPSLFDDLGGEAAVHAVIDGFLVHVAANAEINWFFANTDLVALNTSLYDLVCETTGGGCAYTGADMASAHVGMAITDAQFDSMAGDLLATLDDLGVPYTAGTFDGGLPADILVSAILDMRGDVVTDAAGDLVYFNQLGGHAAVEAVIDGLLANVAADARINGFFATTDLVELDRLLVEQVCEATGGHCAYSGRDMATAHAGLCIGQADFDALVEDLLLALDALGVPYSANLDGSEIADDLLNVLLGMQGDIVTC
jgi:hemoglobin